MKTTITILRNTRVRILALDGFIRVTLADGPRRFTYEADSDGTHYPSVESDFPRDVADWLNGRLARRGLPFRVFPADYSYVRTYDI